MPPTIIVKEIAHHLSPGAEHLIIYHFLIEGRAYARLADGSRLELTAGDIVLAVPPSVWPRIGFEPELPPELRPQMGPVVKYLSVVDRRFWESDRLGPNARTDGMVSVTWDATAGQPFGDLAQ